MVEVRYNIHDDPLPPVPLCLSKIYKKSNRPGCLPGIEKALGPRLYLPFAAAAPAWRRDSVADAGCSTRLKEGEAGERRGFETGSTFGRLRSSASLPHTERQEREI